MMEQKKQSSLKLANGLPKSRYIAMDIRYEDHLGLAWYCMKGDPRPCFTPRLLDETLCWVDELHHNQSLT